MTDIKQMKCDGFLIGSLVDYSKDVQAELVRTTTLPPDIRKGPLGGRGTVSRTTIKSGNIGDIVVKKYSHGGVWRRICKFYYLHLGKYRPQSELMILDHVRSWGVKAPKPIAFIIRGRAIYQAWLIAEEIAGEMSLALLSTQNEELSRKVMLDLGQQVNILIKHRICHVDLHPGNVLIDPNNEARIIDFDKAYYYKGSLNSLRDYYLCRWRRAVIKHGLPEYLSEYFCAELLKNYDKTR